MQKDEGSTAAGIAGPGLRESSQRPDRPKLERVLLAAVLCLLVFLNVRHVLPLMEHYGAHGAADFFIFYSGCHVLQHGLAGHLYDTAVLGRFEPPYYRMRPLPYNHPAYELLVYLPFSVLPPATAFWSWNALNLLLLIVVAWLARAQRELALSATAWIFLAALAFFPVMLTIMQGQDSILMLLIFTLAYTALRSKREDWAGAILAAGSFKFPIIVPFLLPWLLRGRWRLVSGFIAGMALTTALSLAVVGFEGTRQYVAMLLTQLHNPQIGYIDPRWMPNTRGLLSVLFPGARSITIAVAGGLISTLFVGLATLRLARWDEGIRFELWFAMNLVAAILISPHLYGHDLAPVFLAIVLANRAVKNIAAKRVRIACIALSAILFCTPLYLYLQDRDALGLLSVPLVLLFLLLAYAQRSVQWEPEAIG